MTELFVFRLAKIKCPRYDAQLTTYDIGATTLLMYVEHTMSVREIC